MGLFYRFIYIYVDYCWKLPKHRKACWIKKKYISASECDTECHLFAHTSTCISTLTTFKVYKCSMYTKVHRCSKAFLVWNRCLRYTAHQQIIPNYQYFFWIFRDDKIFGGNNSFLMYRNRICTSLIFLSFFFFFPPQFEYSLDCMKSLLANQFIYLYYYFAFLKFNC